MELTDFVESVEKSNSRIPLDEILARNQFEKVVVTSTFVKEVFSYMESYFKMLGIKYELGPSVECHLKKFGGGTYDPAKNLFITVFREREYLDLVEIDKKSKLNVGLLVGYSLNKGNFKELPELANTLAIPPTEFFAAPEQAVKAVFCAGYILAKSQKDETLVGRVKKFRDNYKNIVWVPGRQFVPTQ